MGESVSAELRERARLRRVQGADYVTVEEIRDWLAAEARASDHPFVRRVTAGTLAELDDARARVAELEAENDRLRKYADAAVALDDALTEERGEWVAEFSRPESRAALEALLGVVAGTPYTTLKD